MKKRKQVYTIGVIYVKEKEGTYSKELKLTAVQAYLNGEGSYKTLQKNTEY